MKKFKIGAYYTMHSLGDWDCTWTYKVVSRTAKTITIFDGEENQRCRIVKESEYVGAERVYPKGKYSLAPSLTAC